MTFADDDWTERVEFEDSGDADEVSTAEPDMLSLPVLLLGSTVSSTRK